MTQCELYCMTSDDQVLTRRLSGFLRRQYPDANRDKRLASHLDIHPRTARNYFNNIWPGARAWRAIVRRFGRDVLAAVFEPEIDDVLAARRAEIRRLEDELENQRAAFRALAGHESGVAASADKAA